MGIPSDYNDDNYRNSVPSKVPKSMPPVTKARMASKECVGNNMKVTIGGNKMSVPILGNATKKSDKKISCNLTDENRNSVRNNHDRIRMVQGLKWSVIVYQSCWLKCEPLARAWKHAFVE